MFGVGKATGIIGHWPLNGEYVVGTTARDKGRNGNDGVITVGTGGLTTGIHGEDNGAYLFDGTDTLIDTGVDMIGIKPLTVSALIYPTNWNNGRVIDNGKVVFFIHPLNDILAFTSNGPGIPTAESAYNAIVLGNWYHVCATRTVAGITNIYINGTLSGTANQDGGASEAGTSNVFIGSTSTSTSNFYGKIAKVQFYSFVMSAGQVANLYQSYGV